MLHVVIFISTCCVNLKTENTSLKIEDLYSSVAPDYPLIHMDTSAKVAGYMSSALKRINCHLKLFFLKKIIHCVLRQ